MPKKKLQRRKRVAFAGYAFDFHGSFVTRAKAEAKAKSVKRRVKSGWVISRKVVGMSGIRYIVLSHEKVPF